MTPQTGAGQVEWAELLTSDPSAALKFYTELFGWVKTKAVNLGPAVGTYQMFADARPNDSQGGFMRRPSSIKHSAWIFYTAVADVNAAVATVKELGGKTVNQPSQAPNGRRYAIVSDPQGVVAGLIS
jgi:predicted enzyme related to lactoylglutathione lyase